MTLEEGLVRKEVKKEEKEEEEEGELLLRINWIVKELLLAVPSMSVWKKIRMRKRNK